MKAEELSSLDKTKEAAPETCDRPPGLNHTCLVKAAKATPRVTLITHLAFNRWYAIHDPRTPHRPSQRSQRHLGLSLSYRLFQGSQFSILTVPNPFPSARATLASGKLARAVRILCQRPPDLGLA